MRNINPDKPVMVSGGSGYLASWIIKYLLEEGRTVHATVRNPANTKKTRHLTEIAEKASGTLHLFEADLLKPGSFKEAMKGCELVIHTASPFLPETSKDPENVLVKPALEGTRNVLDSVNETDSVNRVVLTSSVVAINCDASDMEKTENRIFTEKDWNTKASLSYMPYSYSKTLAEKAAWEMEKAQTRWDLVVLNPSYILGPSLTSRKDSYSISFMVGMGNGYYRLGVPEFWLGYVDVRDVARAHIIAGDKSDANGRHILCSKSMPMFEVSNILKKKFGKKYPFPVMTTPKWMAWLIGPLFGLGRKYVKNHMGKPVRYDNTRSRQELGIEFKPVEQTITDHFQQALDDGLIKAR